jgi:hypothetical protein
MDIAPELAVQGREQSRPTGLLRPPAAKCSPILRPSAARMTFADHSLRRGTASCARCSAANRRHPLADTRSKPTSTRFCPKSRSHTKHATKPSLPGSRFVHHHARPSFANALSNRELQLLERTLTHRKQTIAPRSNRELPTNPCPVNSHAVIPTLPFLTGSAPQAESPVTHSKQPTASFLTGPRSAPFAHRPLREFLRNSQYRPAIDSSSRLAHHGAQSK